MRRDAKRCPFCGGEDITMREDDPLVMYCVDCGAECHASPGPYPVWRVPKELKHNGQD